MSRPVALVASFVAIAAAAAILFATRGSGARRIVTPDAELILVRGEYTIVILSPETMKRTFGPQWDHLSLFYGTNRGLTDDGQPAALASSPLRPLAKGTPVLFFSGDRWSDLIVPVYALETRRQATFAIDTIEGTVTVRETGPRQGEPQLTPDGRLFFP